jgi:hypothetical protein
MGEWVVHLVGKIPTELIFDWAKEVWEKERCRRDFVYLDG